VSKHYRFPLIVQKIDGLNVNDDNLTEPLRTVVDNIYLEDLIEFQGIEFTVIKGYYWSGKRDYTIQKVITDIFNKRLQYKKEGNALEQVYKLIMNSCYGKTIQKAINADIKYIEKGEKLDNYWHKTVVDGSKIHSIKVRKSVDNHFCFSLLGIHVLSMSKRIMNEVMCLAEEIGCQIYYMDTDSQQLRAEDLPRLEAAFKEKYGRDLCGEHLGQFHTDFCSMNKRSDVKYAEESIFLMKKMYCHKLLLSDGSYDYMFRGKGLTTKSILYQAEKCGGIMELYQKLYEGNSVTFNLCDGQPCFEMNKDLTVSTRKEFIRLIKTTYEPGD